MIRKIAWHWRYDEKRELWIGWWTLVVFYNLYGLLFFVIARTQPPPPPSLEPSEIVQWFADRRSGLLYGYAIISIVGGATAIMNATLAYTMRRMSVSRAFAYSYLVIYALATLPGMLIMGVVGYGLRKFDFDPAPLVLGLVIAPTFELSLRQSLVMSSGNWTIFFSRPIAAALFAICGLLLVLSAISYISRKDWREKLAEVEAGEK